MKLILDLKVSFKAKVMLPMLSNGGEKMCLRSATKLPSPSFTSWFSINIQKVLLPKSALYDVIKGSKSSRILVKFPSKQETSKQEAKNLVF